MATCKYVYAVGKYAGKQCDIRPGSGDFCYKHKAIAAKTAARKVATEAIAADPIFGGKQGQVAAAGPKKRFSVFNCTINSQKNYSTMSDEEKTRFRDFVDWLFDPSGSTALKFMTDQKAPPGESGQLLPGRGNIVEAKAEHYFEVGDLGKLHAHGQIQVVHTGHITFHANRVRAAAKKILGYTIHWDCQATSDHARAYSEYMRKKVAAVKI